MTKSQQIRNTKTLFMQELLNIEETQSQKPNGIDLENYVFE